MAYSLQSRLDARFVLPSSHVHSHCVQGNCKEPFDILNVEVDPDFLPQNPGQCLLLLGNSEPVEEDTDEAAPEPDESAQAPRPQPVDYLPWVDISSAPHPHSPFVFCVCLCVFCLLSKQSI